MVRIRGRVPLLLAALIPLIGVVGSTQGSRSEASQTLRVAGRANANVSIAASGVVVAAVWSASVPSGPTDIFAAVSRDSGATFSTPVRVNSTIGQVNVNGEQPPRVALAPRPGAGIPRVVVVWTAKGPDGTLLLQSHSDDGGNAFTRSASVPGAQGAGNRGWEAITADSRGRVSVVWLDHRELASGGDSMATAHHHTGREGAKTDGVAMAQRSRLYYSTIDDQSSVRGLTGGVCYCCKTAVTVSPSGLVALAWRHVYPGNLRDIAFSVSRDDGRTFGTPLRVSEDKWQLEGCPDDGPAMAFDTTNVAHIAWPTLVETKPGGTPTIGVFYSNSADARTFTPRVRIPTEGVPHHPQIAVTSSNAIAIVWDELVGGTRRVALATVTSGKDGQPVFQRQVVSGSEPALYPMVVPSGSRFLTAWTSGQPDASVIRIDRR